MDQTTNNSEHTSSASVPPPPAEVAVRTMASDLVSMGESGGGSPKPRPIKIFSRSEYREESARVPVSASTVGTAAPRPIQESVLQTIFFKPAFLFSALGLFLAGVFFIAYYFVYPLLNPKPTTTGVPITTPITQSQSFEHKSFFSKPSDGTFVLDISSPINGLQDERSKVNSFISDISGSFFEITPQNGAGQALSANDFFSSIGGNVLGSDFLDANFENDFTLFIYKDKNALRPGYILQLKAGNTPILLQSSVLKKMESSSSTRANLFMESAGLPIGGKFQGGLSSGQPIWFLNYSNGSSTLAYGWFFNKYLAISTSLEGLRQAILHF